MHKHNEQYNAVNRYKQIDIIETADVWMFLENQQHIHANIIMSLRYLAQRELL